MFYGVYDVEKTKAEAIEDFLVISKDINLQM